MFNSSLKTKLLLSTVLALSFSSQIFANPDLQDEMENSTASSISLNDNASFETDENAPGFGTYLMKGVTYVTQIVPADVSALLIKETVKAVDAQLPGAAAAFQAVTIFSKLAQPTDDQRNEGTVARLIGNKVKNTVSSIPLIGKTLVDTEAQFTPSGYNSLTEDILNNLTLGLGRLKVDANADASNIAGQMTQKTLKSIPLVGKYMASAESTAGKALFGTSTLTEGMWQTTGKAFSGLSSWWNS